MSEKLGFVAMLDLLGRNEESANAFRAAVGKRIAALTLGTDDALHFTFEDSSRLKLYDDGQSCCESRYMQTDDDLPYFVGAGLMSAEVRDAPNMQSEFGEHRVQFLVVTTSKGAFTMACHNEHNGDYGRISIRAATVTADTE